MMKQEFLQLLNEKRNLDAGLVDLTDFPDAEFEVINTVYMYHPCITDEQSMVDFYWEHSFLIIEDMLPRAQKLAEIEGKIFALNVQISALKDEAETYRR